MNNLMTEIKNSYSDYIKYKNLVNWEDEFNENEITIEEFKNKNLKVDKLEKLYNNSIEKQEILIDSIVNTINYLAPEDRKEELIILYEEKYFDEIRRQRVIFEMEISMLRLELMKKRITE